MTDKLSEVKTLNKSVADIEAKLVLYRSDLENYKRRLNAALADYWNGLSRSERYRLMKATYEGSIVMAQTYHRKSWWDLDMMCGDTARRIAKTIIESGVAAKGPEETHDE